MSRILITGASGQLGQSFQKVSSRYPGHSYVFMDRKSLDICDPEMVRKVFAEGEFDYCINCAAYTAVDQAESEPEKAMLINRDATAILARTCRDRGCFFIHFSTDYVYAPSANLPLSEADPVLPTGVYGTSKRAGELAALWYNPASLIIRTSWVYSEFGNNFLKTMLRLGSTRDEISVVYDQVGSPTYAPDLAEAVLHIIGEADEDAFGKNMPSGIFNYSHEGVCSWYDFALTIFEYANVPCRVKAIRSQAFKTAAIRPPYSVLDKSKIKNTFQIEIPNWQTGLKKCLKNL